jgi:serine/threonine protein kinase/tetratricopeptide (TPR) repeat protein
MSETLEQLRYRAMELPRDERATFIEEACSGDEKLEAELLSLVTESENAENFFGTLGNAVLSPRVLEEAVEQEDVLLQGVAVGRYTVVERLGRGGMGTVYRAHDTRLNRDVALKFLYPDASSDADAEARLLSEARAVAALQHPNICVIHEIGEASDGQPFIAMALCDGQTLKQRLSTGPIAPGEAVSIATQVLRALKAAHSRDIVHRDIKPGNIMLDSDGSVKLLDFGLARSADVSATRPGSTPGTVAYMSPEQVRGESVDHRSDLWSVGVVLYEMLAGRRPFGGGRDRLILQEILHENPDPLRGVVPAVPVDVAAVVDRLLQKDREARYESAHAVLADLTDTASGDRTRVPLEGDQRRSRRWTSLVAGMATTIIVLAGVMWWSRSGGEANASALAAPLKAEPSIAVLPLTNLSADSLDAAIAAGMTEDLIATLGRTPGVRVIASTSTAGFRNRTMDVRQIADSLGVANILEGGIQRSGSQLRVEVRLVSGRDGSTLWSQNYDREFKDMFSVQNEIVRTVAGELGLRFDKDRQLRRHRTRSIAAYELYLRGSDPLLLRSQPGVWKSVEYFRDAIAADSTYAAAHAGLALVQVRRGRTTTDPGMPLPVLFALAEKSARKAIALDDSLAEGHFALGRVLKATMEFSEAEAELRRAIALDPTRSIYHRELADLHAWEGRPEEELIEAQAALETDPLNPYAHVGVATALFGNRRYEEALVHLDHVAGHKPPLQTATAERAQCYAKMNRLPEAIALLSPGAEAGDPLYRGLLGYMLARAGQRDEARQLLGELLARRERTGVGAFQVAMVHVGLGDLDQAFNFLDKAIEDRTLSSEIMGPTFDDLHGDPRFQKFKARLGLGH